MENSKTIQSLKNECEQLDERNKEEDVEEKKLDKAHEFLSEVASKFSQLNPPKVIFFQLFFFCFCLFFKKVFY